MAEPLIDIVVLTHSQAHWLDLCIRSIEHHTKHPYRLILVDSASTPECKAVIADAEKRGHTVVTLAHNRSFSEGMNAGVNVGKSKFVCLMNDDVIVTPMWDVPLVQDASNKNVGIAGPRTNFALGAQADRNFIGKVPFLIFFCVMLRRAIWDLLGGLDAETWTGFSTEDIDTSWKVIKLGLELRVSDASFVYHVGHQTLGVQNEQRKREDVKYFQILRKKWGDEWVNKMSTIAKPRTLVASFHAEEWTRVAFLHHLIQMRNDDGGYPFTYYQHVRSPIQLARQVVMDYATDSGFKYVLLLDDDATFPPDVIRRLATHAKPHVAALAYQRKPPHGTCVFEATGEGGLLGNSMEGIEHTGLRKVDVTGLHVALIDTDVIKKMREGLKDAEGKVIVPGTRQYFGGFDNKLGEDFAWSINCRKLGIPIYCDTELIAGHIGSAVVVDERYKKDWLAAGSPG